MTKMVENYEGRGSYGVMCQHCGFDRLHHHIVDVHERPREDGEVISRRAIGKAGPLTDNPSARRGGLVVVLSCEGCSGETHITIEQRKGQTYLDVVPGRKTKKGRR